MSGAASSVSGGATAPRTNAQQQWVRDAARQQRCRSLKIARSLAAVCWGQQRSCRSCWRAGLGLCQGAWPDKLDVARRFAAPNLLTAIETAARRGQLEAAADVSQCGTARRTSLSWQPTRSDLARARPGSARPGMLLTPSSRRRRDAGALSCTETHSSGSGTRPEQP